MSWQARGWVARGEERGCPQIREIQALTEYSISVAHLDRAKEIALERLNIVSGRAMRRILGLDVGDRSIGIAVSDELGLTAQGVAVYQRSSLAADLAYLRRLVSQYDAEAITVGLPKNMNGSLGPQAQKTLGFIDRLRQACTTIPVIVWDERLTTQQAERMLLAGDASRKRRKQVRDQLAAQLMLQNYLEWRRRHPSSPLPAQGLGSLSSTGLVPEDRGAKDQNNKMGEPNADE
jgi:putative Holliday junction resolvase